MTKGELLQKQFLRYANTQDMLLKIHSGEILMGYGNSELNCLDCIGRLKHPNASVIAEKMGMTRSAISKILRKLLGKSAVVSYQLPGNQKEIYYKLTAYGREVYKQHAIRAPELGPAGHRLFQLPGGGEDDGDPGIYEHV